MQPAEHVDHLRRDGAALAAAARRSPDAPVPSCPDWDMAALVGHTGGVHRWVEQIVRTVSVEPVSLKAIAASAPTDPIGVVAWYDDGLAALTSTLAGADPDAAVWNWSDHGPAAARFWFRRMAHETAIHRWDAETAAGTGEPIATDLAVDGVDEYLALVARSLAAEPVPALGGSLHLHATDTDTDTGEWFLTLAPDHLEARREHAKADAAVRGTASDLLLWLLNRKPPGADAGLEIFGDRAVVDAWRHLSF